MEGNKILIVEDDAIIIEDIKDIIEAEGFVVTGIASSESRALKLLDRRLPDLVLLDITLKENTTGIQLAKIINLEYKIPFIYITSYSHKQTLNEAINTDPRGYIIKSFLAKDIVPAVRLALSSVKSASSNQTPSIESINKSLAKPLSPQEYKVLYLICEAKSNPEITQILFISVNNVKSHIKSIYNKLGVTSKVDAINALAKKS